MGYTHFTTGLVAGYFIAGADPFSMAVSGIASLLPDIDSPDSWVGRKIPVLPRIIQMSLGHRGFFHSITAVFLFGTLCYTFLGKDIAVAGGAGYLAHIIGDMLTYSGVDLLWPYKKRIGIPLIKTAGLLEKIVIMPLSIFLLINLVILQ